MVARCWWGKLPHLSNPRIGITIVRLWNDEEQQCFWLAETHSVDHVTSGLCQETRRRYRTFSRLRHWEAWRHGPRTPQSGWFHSSQASPAVCVWLLSVMVWQRPEVLGHNFQCQQEGEGLRHRCLNLMSMTTWSAYAGNVINPLLYSACSLGPRLPIVSLRREESIHVVHMGDGVVNLNSPKPH